MSILITEPYPLLLKGKGGGPYYSKGECFPCLRFSERATQEFVIIPKALELASEHAPII